MSEVAIKSVDPEYDAKTNEELLAIVSEGIGVTAVRLKCMARAISALERREFDLSELKMSMTRYLRLIADGQLLPELVARMIGDSRVLNKLLSLPLSTQQRICDGETFEFVFRDETGQYQTRKMGADDLGARQVAQLFNGDVRSPAAQIAWIESHRGKVKIRANRKPIHPDAKKDGIWVGKRFASRAEILSALAALGAIDDDSPRSEKITISVTAKEKENLRVICAKAGGNISLPDMVRNILHLHSML